MRQSIVHGIALNNLEVETEQVKMAGTYKQRDFRAGIEDQSLINELTTRKIVVREPVRLSPGWESTDKPDDELNFRNVTMDQVDLELNPPSDKLNIVYIIMVLHGIGTLMPWNMFITARNYFEKYKFSSNYTGANTTYASYYVDSVSFAAQVPNVIFNWINLFVPLGGDLTTRIVWGILVQVLIFVETVVMAMLDTSSWPGVFFWVTMFSVVVLNTCFDTYFALPINKFYRYHEMVFQKQKKKRELQSKSKIPGRTPYWTIFKQCSPQLFNIFFVFFVTLSVFPAVQSSIKVSDENFIVSEKYYMSVMCFVTFNVTAMLGSMLASYFQWPQRECLVVPVVLRVLFIPLFLVCNYQPLKFTRTMPVLITNDFVYFGIAVLMGVSSGYFSSLGMMYCPSTVDSRYASTAGMFAAAFLITGIFTGVLFAIVMPYIVSMAVWE
ncbi:hypothetical protein G9C98_006801 [Cotesia typhae]|uniref:Equilibrative nucleoside transporter 1 n=1 Tax=Cotesia typhae TaxID=2053667 RepID=A0A8J5UTD5_9HYME|nr:hypothetical protein G9C98_006801 [Cotesia typhae]